MYVKTSPKFQVPGPRSARTSELNLRVPAPAGAKSRYERDEDRSSRPRVRFIAPSPGRPLAVSSPKPPFTSIYIHIPFCRNMCGYCHFYRMVPSKAQMEGYPQALYSEIEGSGGMIEGPVQSIYVGGGTPSLMQPEFYKQLMKRLWDIWEPSSRVEATVEADFRINPEQMSQLRTAGFNRISIGIKSYLEEGLAALEIGPAKERGNLVRYARESGFESVGIDLVYGYAGQTVQDLAKDLDIAVLAGPDHISLYALQENLEGPREVDSDMAALMFRDSNRFLIAAGFKQYEITNYSMEGHECLHNLNYWNDGDYLGLGPSAHSSVTREGTRLRWRNTDDLDAYMREPLGWREEMGSFAGRDRAAEAMMLALRTSRGVNRDLFTARYGFDPAGLLGESMDIFMSAGLLRTSQKHIRLTTRGMLLSNEVFQLLV